MKDLVFPPSDVGIPECPLDGSLNEIRYSNVVLKRYAKSMIKPERPTYLYDLKTRTFYSMNYILPSICSYDGVSDMLRDLSNIDPNFYVIAPMYSTNLVNHNSTKFVNRFSKSQNEMRLIPSLHNPNRCNAGDIQPLFGGKLKIKENDLDGVIREIREESTLIFEMDNIVEHSRHNNYKLNICYYSLIDSVKLGINDRTISYSNLDNTKDDPKRKVCMAIYGTAKNIANRIVQIPMESIVGDNIIGMAILPIEVAIEIDSHSIRYWNNRNKNATSFTLY